VNRRRPDKLISILKVSPESMLETLLEEAKQDLFGTSDNDMAAILIGNQIVVANKESIFHA
jgi:hypothetical protein